MGASQDRGAFDVGVSDRPLETPTAINFSQFLAGHLDRLGDEDLFTFDAEAGDVITVHVSGSNVTPL